MTAKPSRRERAIGYAMSQAQAARYIADLPEAVRTVAIVHSAQGIINNGGLQYFFETDFPGKPPYSLFVDAYRLIGATEAAEVLERAVALFPFDKPHRHVKKRNAFMDRFNDEEGDPVNSPFEPLTKVLCGNKNVWSCLDGYIQRNAKVLAPD